MTNRFPFPFAKVWLNSIAHEKFSPVFDFFYFIITPKEKFYFDISGHSLAPKTNTIHSTITSLEEILSFWLVLCHFFLSLNLSHTNSAKKKIPAIRNVLSRPWEAVAMETASFRSCSHWPFHGWPPRFLRLTEHCRRSPRLHIAHPFF